MVGLLVVSLKEAKWLWVERSNCRMVDRKRLLERSTCVIRCQSFERMVESYVEIRAVVGQDPRWPELHHDALAVVVPEVLGIQSVDRPVPDSEVWRMRTAISYTIKR